MTNIVLLLRKNFCFSMTNDESWTFTQIVNITFLWDSFRLDWRSQDLSNDIEIDLREEYTNDRNFCDDNIYRHLRISQRMNNAIEKNKWLARLSKCKRKNLKQFQRRQELRRLTFVLNDLLSYVKLWSTLQIETFHRLLNLKCSKIDKRSLCCALLMIIRSFVNI